MADEDDAPLANPGQPGAIPNDQPTGLPADEPDDLPLGVDRADPDGEGDTRRGEDAMPGFPTDGEPQTGG